MNLCEYLLLSFQRTSLPLNVITLKTKQAESSLALFTGIHLESICCALIVHFSPHTLSCCPLPSVNAPCMWATPTFVPTSPHLPIYLPLEIYRYTSLV